MDVKKKHEIEAALATEAQAISSGQLKEENPLDTSEDFRVFCEACRRGDLKVCQEMISTESKSKQFAIQFRALTAEG
jgi:ankyrin repeat/BTB/POZ domain-containing protein 1